MYHPSLASRSHRSIGPTIGLIMVAILVPGCDPQDTATQTEPATATPLPVETTPDPADFAKTPSIDIPNAKMPFESVLVGGQPSIEQLGEAAQAGYSTIVNLRPPGENTEWDEEQVAADLGLRYVNIPIAGPDDLTPDNATKLAEIIGDSETRPLIVHCASGNRVGALFALRAFHVDHEDAASALQAGLDAGLTSLEGAVKERLIR